jgi:hypothetical protein
MDITYSAFHAYVMQTAGCAGDHRCYLIDRRGFVLVSAAFTTHSMKGQFIGTIEPQVFRELAAVSVMVETRDYDRVDGTTLCSRYWIDTMNFDDNGATFRRTHSLLARGVPCSHSRG